jgi:8-oxo-dGTP pyrophosphatase MutT (NUDIX family)
MIESSQTMFHGRILTVNVERVRLPNGRTANLEIAHHPGGAAIVALDGQGRVCLLRQYRHAAQGWIWELPAGKIDDREPPIATARRELAEEAGMSAGSWLSLGGILSSPGVFTEVVHLYLATHLTPVPAAPEEHEVFAVTWLPWQEAVLMAECGVISDGKSVSGLLRCRRLLARI